jgi:hypothetical protein
VIILFGFFDTVSIDGCFLLAAGLVFLLRFTVSMEYCFHAVFRVPWLIDRLDRRPVLSSLSFEEYFRGRSLFRCLHLY